MNGRLVSFSLFLFSMGIAACGQSHLSPEQEAFFGADVVDRYAPRLILNGDVQITLEAKTPYVELGAVAWSLLEGNLSSQITITGSVDTHQLGDYEIVYRIQDRDARSDEKTRYVHVVDRLAPNIELLGESEMILEQGSTYDEPGVQAFDAFEGNLSSLVERSGTVDTNVPGIYELSYRVSDSSGNLSAELIRRVIVQPVI